MPRRGQATRNAVRRAKRQTTGALDSQQGSYEAPDRDAFPPKQWDIPYDDANTVRLQFNLWRSDGRLVNFVINVQVLASEGWQTVEYFDCCHGHCHLHRQAEVPTDTILRLDAVEDVHRAFERAKGEAEDRVRIIRDKGA